MHTIVQIIICAACFGAAFSLLEIIQRTFAINTEVSRKVAHIFGAAGAAILPYIISWSAIIWTALLFIGVMTASKRLDIYHSIHHVTRRTFGEIYLPLAVFATALPHPNKIHFAYAMLVLAVSDTAASFFGSRYGKRKIMHNKTLVGSTVFFVSAFIVGFLTLYWQQQNILMALGITVLGAAVTTIAELVSPNGLDNITIPVSALLVSSLV